MGVRGQSTSYLKELVQKLTEGDGAECCFSENVAFFYMPLKTGFFQDTETWMSG